MYMDETGHISLITNLIVILQWGNKGGEGEVDIIHMCIYTCILGLQPVLMLKKKARQVN